MFSLDEVTLQRNTNKIYAGKNTDKERNLSQWPAVTFLNPSTLAGIYFLLFNLSYLKLPPTASIPRHILKAEAPLVVWKIRNSNEVIYMTLYQKLGRKENSMLNHTRLEASLRRWVTPWLLGVS